jgi:type II secretory pathway pseudopilin PulG
MAGLLDIFGTGGTQALGLLGGGDIEGARNDAQAQALYALAGSLLSGGPTGMSIVKGLQQGQQAYRSAMRSELEDRAQQYQLQEFKRKKEEEEAAKQRQRMIDAAIARAYVPGQAAVEAPTPTGPISGAAFGEVSTPAVASKLDLQSITPALMATREGRAALSELAKTQEIMQPKMQTLKEGEKLGYLQDGKFVEVAGLPKQKALKEVDLGNVVVMLDDQGKEVMRFAKGRAPEGPVSLQTVETEQGIATFNPKTGALTPVMQGGKPVMGKGAGQLTESQGNAVTFGMRMSEANKTLTALESAGLKDTGMLRAGISGTVGAIPLIGESMSKGVDNIFNVLPSIMGGLNEAQQSALQARVNFITAVLRKESGASISPSEFATAEKNYFPAPGDSEKTIAQKQKAREMAIKGMKIQAGPGAKYIGQETGVTSSGW